MPRSITLFLLGFLTLFLELALIRYLAGNVWNLGYFPNFVLLAVFVGMGAGFVLHQALSPAASTTAFGAAALLVAGLLAFVYLARPGVPGFATWGGDVGGELYFTSASQAEGATLARFAALFAAMILVFACIAQRTAKVFREFPPLRAYTLDIAGSCAGIVVFTALSLLGAPPWCWFALASAVFLATASPAGRIARASTVAALAATTLISWMQDTRPLDRREPEGRFEVHWSPYQKLEYLESPGTRPTILANGLGHQNMYDAEALRGSFYDVPHLVRAQAGLAPYRDVLVMGAGSGNDVAVALAQGAAHVDAVEIDPVIAALGRAHHPARPYDDPRVSVTIDDARAFLARTRRRYDLIIFALTDSVVKASAVAQLRLENYLFTVESVRRASDRLNPGGDVVLYNYYRTPWLVDKIAHMIQHATGRFPVVIHQKRDLVMLRAGSGGAPLAPAAAPTAAGAPEPPTDDWPFLYLLERGVPELYARALGGGALLVLLLLLAVRRMASPAAGADAGLGTRVAFLLLGAAFLLLETKSVVQWSLLFGTTWLVNSLVFIGILLLVLAANWAAQALRIPRLLPVAFVLLIASSLLALVWPLSNLLRVESVALRFAFAALLTFSPIFFANLIFSLAFRDQAAPEHVFGWNLLGATLGGLLEYASMAVGYNALAALVAACYALAFAALSIARRPAPAAPA